MADVKKLRICAIFFVCNNELTDERKNNLTNKYFWFMAQMIFMFF